MNQEHRVRLAAAAAIPDGEAGQGFDILAITAGTGNGWQFPAGVLEESLPCWEGVGCFVDHHPWGGSVRDLAGVCRQPLWDAQAQGVRLSLRAMGPSGPLLAAVGREMLTAAGGPLRVGFSADVLFQAQGKRVDKIVKVLSVDLVVDPARGGRFVREWNQNHRGETMNEAFESEGNPTSQAETGAEGALCAALLEASLQASRLPPAAAEQVRRQFAGQVFAPDALQKSLEEARQLVSALTGGLSVQGPGRVSGVFSSEDQLQAAVDDLLGAPREAGMQGLRAARLSGIRELYLLLTGDEDLHGGYDPQRVRLATTADFSGLVKNALNKVIANRWEELGRAGYDWWQRVAWVEHFNSLQAVTGTLMGTVGSLPQVEEGDPYTELQVGDSAETTQFMKFGGYIPLTLELIDRDETRKLRAYPRELAAAGLRKISELVAEVFTANSGVGPTMSDSGALFNATAVATAGGHANLSTTALSAAAWDQVCRSVYEQPMLVKNSDTLRAAGPQMGINPRYLLVPRALQLTAKKILYPMLENAANITSENQQQGQPGDVITVPEWTDATNWAAVCAPRVVPAIFVGERFGLMPEVFLAGSETSPAVFSHDEHRLKVRHFLAVWVNDYRPLHKCNVAG